ncbi:50S ribosomal protein L15 [Rickettsiella massiliensis]|uniref:50S ribosomal protein L15 n=1 Tax=Rickettsiella massiliensis TaxID=676517 RepID=UPI00029AF7C5|nr:50S ribosomal protein L15 [Rickettsiella massiliensis]
MYLNTIKPAPGAKTAPKRLGRGIGSGLGKTSGRGHKGQHARAGGFHKLGFEGGQSPLQRRLPKFGFTPIRDNTHQVFRLDFLNKVEGDLVSIESLKAAKLVKASVQTIKLINTGTLTKKITVKGLKVSKGARASIEALGGCVEE